MFFLLFEEKGDAGSYTLIFVGVFVYMAAGQEGRTVQVKGILGDVRVRQAMSRQVASLAPGDPLSRAVELTLHTLQADFPVVRGGSLVGFLTEKDLLAGLHQSGAAQQVGEVMHRDYVAISPDASLFEVQQQISNARLRAVPVTEDSRLVGLLTLADVNEAYRLFSVEPELATPSG